MTLQTQEWRRELQGYKEIHGRGYGKALTHTVGIGTPGSEALKMVQSPEKTEKLCCTAVWPLQRGKRWVIYLRAWIVSKRVPHQPRTHPCSYVWNLLSVPSDGNGYRRAADGTSHSFVDGCIEAGVALT